jgi:ABC-type molybdate transport system substrate-binding protein
MRTRSGLGVVILLAWTVSVTAAEIKVLSGNGARAAVSELCAQFERASGHRVALKFAVNPQVKRSIEAGEMKPKMRPMPAEYNVEVVARGEAELVVVVASRISGVAGVQLVGRIPQELQTWIGFTAGAATAAKEPEAARAMLRFFTAPAAASVLRATGIEPFVE